MAELVTGLFKDSDDAGEAVSELKNHGFTDDISVIAKDENDIKSHQIQQDVTDGTVGGATAGGILGAITGVIAGVATAVVPGLGTLIVAGPIAALWGVTGGAIGALTGGLVGALVDAGIPEERAKLYEERVKSGEVLVAVTADASDVSKVHDVLNKYNPSTVEHRQNTAFA